MKIREFLSAGKPLLFDGAMGTLFASRPGNAGKRCEQANLENPEEVRAIHTAYLEAGCRAVKTNTFSLGQQIAEDGREEAEALLRAGFDLAAQCAAKTGAFVFADLGPAPVGAPVSPAENYILQGERFLEKGAECFLLETLGSFAGVPEFAAWLKERSPDAFLTVCFAVGPDGFSREGVPGTELFRLAAEDKNIDMTGFNCFSGPQHMENFLRTLDLRGKNVCVMPNAGYPTVLGRRTVYSGTPDYFARRMEGILDCGVCAVGGCCGTTPEHIAALCALLTKRVPKAPGAETAKPSRREEENPLWNKLESGKYLLTVEYDPPAGDDLSVFLAGAEKLRRAGVDAMTIADCPVGIPRADSSLMACRVKRELGLEPIPHMTCRDRNLNATKALLMGLSAEGVHNVLLVTGDPMPSEKRDEVKSVFNCNSRKLARYVTAMGEETLNTPFRIFGALNVNARNFDIQLSLAQEKEECGVCGFLTQPVLSETALENLRKARQTLKGKILGGIFPVVSYRNAVFMNNEIAGIHVSDEICELYRDKDRAECEKIALELSVKIAAQVKPYTDGLYLMTPLGRVELICRIVDALRENGF